MKPIALPFRHTVVLPEGEYNVSATWDTITQLRQRGARVIASALAVEDVMIQILANTLLGELKEQREFAVSLILNSDWCSFSAKRKLLMAAIERFNLSEVKAKAQLDESLSRVMRYRNAFAHGAVEFDGSNFVLRYFETSPRVATLDDAYWEKLEKAFNEPWELLLAMETKSSESRG